MSDGAVLQARLVGALFVERGLLTPEQLERALELQAERGDLLGEILVTEFDISRIELASVLAEQWAELERQEQTPPSTGPADVGDTVEPHPNGTAASRRRIGEIFVERGFASADDIEAALEEQRSSGKPLGEVLIERGNLSRLDLASALAEQWAGLEKLRPPAPKRVEGWQQVAPLEHAAAAAQAAARAADEPAPTEADGAAPSAEVVAELAAIADRVAAVESLRDGTAAAQEEISRIQAGLDELRERLTHPEARLGEIEGRVGALEAGRADTHGIATHEELEKVAGALAQRLDGLRARLDDAVTGTNAGLDAMLETVAELQERVAGLAGGSERSQPAPELAELRSKLDRIESAGEAADRLAERIHALESRDDAPWRGEVEALQARLDALAASGVTLAAVEERLAAAVPDGVPTKDEVASLRSKLEEVAAAAATLDELGARIAALESAPQAEAWRDEAALLRSRLDELAHAAVGIDSLRERVAAIEDGAAAAPWRDDTARLQARLEELAATLEPIAALDERIASLEGAARERPSRKDLRRLGEELGARVDELAGGLADAPWRRDVEAVRSELAALAAGAPDLDAIGERLSTLEARDADEPWRAEIAAVRSELGRVAAAAPQLDPLVERLAALESRVDEPHWRDELAALHARVDDAAAARASLDVLTRRLEELEHRGEEAPWRDELSAVRAELQSVSSRVASVGELADRLATLEGIAEQRPWGDELHRVADGLTEQVSGLAGRVDAVDEASRSARERLEGRISALADELGSRLGDWATTDHDHPEIAELALRVEQLGHTVGATGELTERLAAVEHAAATRPWGEELGRVADELRARLDGIAARLGDGDGAARAAVAELEERIAALTAQIEALTGVAWAPADHGHPELAALQSQLGRLDELGRTADGLRERLEAMERLSAATPKREEVAGLYARLDELGNVIGDEAITAVRAEIEDVRRDVARIDTASGSTVADLARRLDAVGAAVADLEAAMQAAASAVDRSELERVERVLEEVAELARDAGRAATHAEEHAGARGAAEADARTALERDLRERLEAAMRSARDDAVATRSRVDELAASVEAHAAGISTDVASQLAALSDALEALAGDVRDGRAVEPALRAAEARLDAALAGHDEAIAVLRRRVEQVATLDSVLSDRLTASEGAMAARVEEITGFVAEQRASAEATLGVLAGRVDELAERLGRLSSGSGEGLEALGARIESLGAALAELSASGASSVEALAGRLEAVELGARATPGALQALGEHMTELQSRLEAVEATAASALRASSGWTDAATALGTRLIATEEALGAAGLDTVGPRLGEMERRLAVEASQADARAQATEEALRDGLATLAARLAERESAYAEAGNALRRSVEGLGRAIARADHHLAERDDQAGAHRRSDAYVAFAPTGDGYRLVAVDAPAPEVGATVVLDGEQAVLTVTRIGVSPIPLDDRPCAYLEPAAPAVPTA